MIYVRRDEHGVFDINVSGNDLVILNELYVAVNAVSGHVFKGLLYDKLVDDVPQMTRIVRDNAKIVDATQFEKLMRNIRPEDDND